MQLLQNLQQLHPTERLIRPNFIIWMVLFPLVTGAKPTGGTQFRIWATGILKESMRKEFVPDDERLKNRYKGSDLPEDSTCANFAQVEDNRT